MGATNSTGLSSRAIVGRFYARLEQELALGWMSRLAMTFGSDQESETYKWLGMVPALREWKGGRLAKALRDNGITIDNKLWEATLAFNVDEKRRDKTGQMIIRIAELARRAAAHPVKLISTLISNGHASTSGLCYDGQYFFDTDHSEGDSGAQKNLLTATEVATLNVGTATAPTEAEMAQAIMGVISYMIGYLDDQGEPMNEGARAFDVMVPIPLFSAAYAASSKDVLHAAAGNTTDNVLKGGAFKINVVANPRLNWTTDFGVFRSDASAKPFIFQEELPLEVKAVAEGSELEFNENEHHYGLKWIGNAGYGYWQYGAKATLS